jgi:hypothetical protein
MMHTASNNSLNIWLSIVFEHGYLAQCGGSIYVLNSDEVKTYFMILKIAEII